ncbi:NUDIX domain-containing protein [Halostella sp. JP-L12]|uniref:NUDIX domain-containing protein n=1 Tax=Halostella TaxID=1843185 RepID=UPI000EF778AB|nr:MULTISPECIES: NUDIX domain-containing protein [Halostella]NHN49929.1 NUDIX domain-containing protein [Halostella sp. JP-L12]
MRGAPDHCTSCGGALSGVDPPTVFRCDACGEYAFRNPTPNARVVVLDGDSVLLVEIADEARIEDPPYDAESEWMTPGGAVEVGEHPDEAAARELAEETGLVADPDALELFDAVTREVVEDTHALVLLYAADRADVAGTPAAASDAADAWFWHPDELAAADATFRDLHDEPRRYRDLEGFVAAARAALEADE